MTRNSTHAFFLITPYWLGIVADALWAIALFLPPLFGALVGIPDFSPDQDFRLTMAVAGVLMTGWTILLLWAVRQPIERRFVILLTAFPVVFGLFIIAMIQVLHGNRMQIWILIKTAVLFASMIGSYVLATRADRQSG